MARMRIKDIAEQAGVSPATVSRFLNDRPGQMTEETRARIAAVIERTGYRPRTAARNLRSEQSHLIGVVIADIRNPYSSAMLEALSAEASARGYALITVASANDPEVEAAGITRLMEAGVDGLVINTCGGNDEQVVRVASGIPVVLLDRPVVGARADVVTSNNAQLMRELVAAVADDGAEPDEAAGMRPAAVRGCYLLTEADDASPVRRIRAQAFDDELARRGLEGGAVALSTRTGRAAEQLAALCEGRPLGVIAVNGLVFLRAVEALAAQGPSLPPGVRLATFDDYPWNHVLYGGVTAAVQDTGAIASAVMERMARRVECSMRYVGEEAFVAPERFEIAGAVKRRASTHPLGNAAETNV